MSTDGIQAEVVQARPLQTGCLDIKTKTSSAAKTANSHMGIHVTPLGNKKIAKSAIQYQNSITYK